MQDYTGPLTLVDGAHDREDLELAARVTARYSHGKNAPQVTVRVQSTEGTTLDLEVAPLHPDDIPQEWFV